MSYQKPNLTIERNADMAVHPVLVMFMWASGANFETRLNLYENNPLYSPQLESVVVGVGDNGTETGNGSSVGIAGSNGMLNLTGLGVPGLVNLTGDGDVGMVSTS